MSDFKTLTPEQVLRDRIRVGVKLVDVRTDEERSEQFIPGSLHIPLQDFAANHKNELSEDDEIIIYCQHGVRSKHAASYLTAKGYTNVSHMAGGLAIWTGPVEPE